MGKGLDQLEDQIGDIRDDGMRYAELKWTQIKLRIVENLSTLLSKAYGYIIFLVLIFIALIFIMLAVALVVGEALGHFWLGFLISGGAVLIGAFGVYFFRDRFVVHALIRYFIDVFFPEEEVRDGRKR